MKRLIRAERTTTINFDDESNTAFIVTYNRPWITSLENNPAATLVRNYPGGGVEYKIPKKLIGKPRKQRAPRRAMTAAEKSAAADRLAAARTAKAAV